MNTLFLILIVVLFSMAVIDLVVGVSNDAVNFLNSAIGSKAASFKVIMIIAALGILVGATFSGGMMEVARKGIFHPEHFYFTEILIIFLAVMVTDIILLDVFNTFGLPTSTTVSIVFELLGAAVAISLIKVRTDPNALELIEYINTGKALSIITGILLSVGVAFTVGAFVQYITRILFSFNYTKRLKYLGAIWGGLAITAITYFMLIKGAKGATFMSPETKDFIKENSLYILGISFIGWTILLQILTMLVRINILKTIVLVGTFALAMAFAGNDLVNFIGVPLAGMESFKAYMADPGANPDTFSMTALTGKVATPTLFLVIAGLIMVATLWLSRKARSVIETSLNLSRQNEGQERFGSSIFARSIVRTAKSAGSTIRVITPAFVYRYIDKQYEKPKELKKQMQGKDAPTFDLLRASVNLVVASILISFATSLKLPLSTTYVTFMVAMGTSLADRAWGSESAVYRITGVLSVIGGWFFTALSAFSVAFGIAMIIHFGTLYSVFALLALAIFFLIKSQRLHKKKEIEKEKDLELIIDHELQPGHVLEKNTQNVKNILKMVSSVYNDTLIALFAEDRKKLKENSNKVKEINQATKKLKDNIPNTIQHLNEDSIETGPYYIQVLDYLRETAHCLTYISKPCFDHIDNNHKGLNKRQQEELEKVRNDLNVLLSDAVILIDTQDYSKLHSVIKDQKKLLSDIKNANKNQMKRIKHADVGTRNSMLYLAILHETKNIVLYLINLLKAHRDFVDYSKET